MPSVGPELPPHLAKRKRSTSDPEDLESPPQKIIAASTPRTLGPTLPPSNPDALELNDSSEDEYGPSANPPKRASPPRRVVGPSAPPKNPDAVDLDESSDDEYGPSAGPAARAAVTGPSLPARRVLGPAAPPANLSERPSHAANSDDESSDDDGYGPAPPPAPGSAAEAAMLQKRAREVEAASRSALSNEPAKPARDSWMLVPPTDSDWSTRVDPTKLKNRKFASGKGAVAEKGQGISAIWTESPAEKRQRLEDEVLGRKEAAGSAKRGGGAGDGKDREETQEERRTARRIKEYNEKNRGKSLLEQHTGNGGVKEEDDPSKRSFDREKDMALGGRLGHGQKKELLAKAADFGSRFQKGKYL